MLTTAIAIAAAGIALALAVTAAGGTGARAASGAAPSFSLPATDGTSVSLTSLRGSPALLYFNEGVGCDACFYQQAKIEAATADFERAGVRVVPIAVNSADQLRAEMQRFGLVTPFLVDADRSVSAAYKTIGKGHHADLPGHSFVLVDAKGQLRWRLDDPSMFVDPARLLRDVNEVLGR